MRHIPPRLLTPERVAEVAVRLRNSRQLHGRSLDRPIGLDRSMCTTEHFEARAVDIDDVTTLTLVICQRLPLRTVLKEALM